MARSVYAFAMRQASKFGSFRFEPQTARLWSGATEVRLTPKAAAVLACLLDRAGQPVSKQDLFASIWRDTVVSDDALVSCIQELRHALNDDAKRPRYIETRHRLGYRFVAELLQPGESAESNVASIKDQSATIAVLPFLDLSPGRDQDYFCEGLAEEVIDALTRVAGFRVVARGLSFQFRNAAMDVREVGRKLGADSLLEGSVRKAGDRLRITVQLIDVASGCHKWSERFEAQLGDVFAIQERIAATVASILRGGDLSGREKNAVQRPHTATDTYEYFLRGRQSMHRLQQPDMDHALGMFRSAIELDSTYAPAWAGLAMTYALLYEWWGSRDEDLRGADDASRVALSLAPNLAEAHVARAFALSLHRAYDEAQQHFESAIRINSQLFDAYYLYGRSSFARGKIERSAELFRRAAEVRQDDFQSAMLWGQSLRILGRRDEAASVNAGSIRRAERILALNPNDVRTLSLGAGALFEDGQIERALRWSQRALQINPDDIGALINAACVCAKQGLKEEAIGYLEKVFGRGCGKRDWIEADPDYDGLRDDPRFQALLAKLK
jgi:TolB-like protein/tetratricopeptide (TPR) repeat protein